MSWPLASMLLLELWESRVGPWSSERNPHLGQVARKRIQIITAFTTGPDESCAWSASEKSHGRALATDDLRKIRFRLTWRNVRHIQCPGTKMIRNKHSRITLERTNPISACAAPFSKATNSQHLQTITSVRPPRRGRGRYVESSREGLGDFFLELNPIMLF